ncbi:MAG: 50S ribosomal protein L24 [Chitinispirillaceae bacterium]|nr:50S ribosomal protein L24 [Chitinispirillaceae bacterium]
MSFRVRKNDTVQVMSGEFRGKTGRVVKVFPEKSRALVEGLNIVKRHTKPNRKTQQGGIVQKEAPLHLSNLMLVCPKTGKPTRIGVSILDGGKRVRFSKRAKETIA